MAVRAGYKQTEVGVIPVEWEVVTLNEISRNNGLVRGPFGGTLKKEIFVESGFKVYEQRNAIYGSTKLGNYFINEQKYKELIRFSVKPGDFIISCSGTIGKIFQIPERAPDGIINQALLKIQVDPMIIEPMFFMLFFRWDKFQNKIIDNSQGGAMQNLVGMDVFKSTLFPLPPLPEQHVIAEVLADVDGLIEALDALIAKKSAIMQGAMQQLLSGKTRLPGFGGGGFKQTEVGVIPAEWEVETFGDLFDFSGGYSASRAQLSVDGHPYLHYGDIHKSDKTYIDIQSEYQKIPKLKISLDRISRKTLLDDGDVVFVDASEDDEGASKHVVVINKGSIPFISGLHTIVAKSKTDDLNHKYRRYCFQSTNIRQQFRFFAVGTKVTGISKTNIAKLLLPLPSLPEQHVIAEALSDMDTEIAALEQRRAKTVALKHGMMQELLTGKTRLL
jgi:type I restriction enzyme, S subunit